MPRKLRDRNPTLSMTEGDEDDMKSIDDVTIASEDEQDFNEQNKGKKKVSVKMTNKNGHHGRKRASDDELADEDYVPEQQDLERGDSSQLANPLDRAEPSGRAKKAKTMVTDDMAKIQRSTAGAKKGNCVMNEPVFVQWFQKKIDEADDRVQELKKQLNKVKTSEEEQRKQVKMSKRDMDKLDKKIATQEKEKEEACQEIEKLKDEAHDWKCR
ncbi:hypothetical protein XA68_10759 [Ophiocordyceps unilateralis]|uniref:Uncharacterized protein n=1 Tax=Ophiocordyceps unilateralis TaxID=268505 RepID=A0A2A9P290_OPHUN|nr:hypothetical protein XA68_10759 [Ophiocordyceps unilateralis]